MSLIHESNRLMLLSALRHAKPELLREIMKESPDENRVVSGLKAHNDELHSHLQSLASGSPDEQKQTTSNVQPTTPRRPSAFGEKKLSRAERVTRLLNGEPHESY